MRRVRARWRGMGIITFQLKSGFRDLEILMERTVRILETPPGSVPSLAAFGARSAGSATFPLLLLCGCGAGRGCCCAGKGFPGVTTFPLIPSPSLPTPSRGRARKTLLLPWHGVAEGTGGPTWGHLRSLRMCRDGAGPRWLPKQDPRTNCSFCPKIWGS